MIARNAIEQPFEQIRVRAGSLRRLRVRSNAEKPDVLALGRSAQHAGLHQHVQHRLARGRTRGEPPPRLRQRQPEGWRIEKGLLHPDDQVLNPAAAIGNHRQYLARSTRVARPTYRFRSQGLPFGARNGRFVTDDIIGLVQFAEQLSVGPALRQCYSARLRR